MEVIMIDKWSFVVQEYFNTENYPTIKEILQNFNKSQNEKNSETRDQLFSE